jgi:DNA-binding protein H-NS
VLDQDVKHQSPSIIGDASISAKDPARMSVDELWTFYQKVGEMLAEKITSELQRLQRRLALLEPEISREANRGAAGPTAPPKYRNPEQPEETWAGRGRQPRWLKTQLGLGKRLEDLIIR